MSESPFRIGFVLFPDLTQLDLTGPYEVLARMPGAETHLVAKTMDPVRTELGLTILPTVDFANCPPLDLICVPGGPGINQAVEDAELVAFVQRMAKDAGYVTSVCTGSLVLGAAGLLRGRTATTHWMSVDMLAAFGATPSGDRVVIDGNVITGGGVTSGIDFALRVVEQIKGRGTAEALQLALHYDPEPPFVGGSPARSPKAVVDAVTLAASARQTERQAAVDRAAAKLAGAA